MATTCVNKRANPNYMQSQAYAQALCQFNKPNYIPVTNKATWDYDVLAYYNQYYATPYETQQRRIMRNYINNQNTIKTANQNNYTNNQGKKFAFFYGLTQSYMLIQYTDPSKKYADLFTVVNGIWQHVKRIQNYKCGQKIV
jgi:hypothetical protein